MKAFAAGADIKEMADASPFEMIGQGRVEKWDRIRGIKSCDRCGFWLGLGRRMRICHFM